MIFVESKLKVADNSGAKWARCIKIIGKGNKKVSNVGSLIMVTLSNFITSKKVKKRTIYLGLIINVKSWVRRLDGSWIKFFSNRILIFNKQYKFLGTRVYGAISKEIRWQNKKDKNSRKYFQKIISYSSLTL